MSKKALIIDIQRLSTEDGPGIRTTVFFKGCNLRCAWYHNPESLSFKKQIEWYADRCMGCRLCAAACTRQGLNLDENGMQINRERCIACGTCVRECPAGAMAVKGEDWNVDSLVYEVLKDRAYFAAEGGITASGGEALMQADFVAAFFEKLKAQGVHTTLDTAALVDWSIFEKVLPHTDLVLLDLKLFDAEQHKRFTGVDNARILENATRLAQYIARHGSPALWVRTPIIPGATNSHENIAAIGRFIRGHLGGVEQRWELCAFNNLCRDKYTRLDMEWDFAETALMSKSQMEALHKVACGSRGDPSRVFWTGSTLVENT